MYSCDILPIPKYAKQLNLSSLASSVGDQQSSSRIRKPNQKFKLLSVKRLHTIKKDEAKNFYHHSSIYNIKEYKDLTKSPVFFQDSTNQKLSELQTKVLVTDFQRKVAAYLLRAKDTKNVKKYYSELKGCDTQQSVQYNQEILNRSLCLNKYNCKPECKNIKQYKEKSEIGIEVMLMDNNKMVAKSIIPNERLQNRLLKFMEKFLNDDHIDYDQKMQLMTHQYKEVVKKIKTKAFKIKVPDNYQVQMSDYNDYYHVTERQKRDIYEQQFDSLADQIIQSLQQSESLSSQKNSMTDLQEPIQTQPDVSQIQMQEEQQEEELDDQVIEMKMSKKSNKQKDPKKITKKNSIRQNRPSVVRQNSELVQQIGDQQQQNNQQSQQQQKSTLENIEPIHEEEIRQTIEELTEAIKKPAKKHMTKAQREEQKKRKKEIQQLHEHIEKVKKEKGGDFEYEKSDSDSEERFRRQKMQNYEDMFKPKQISRGQSDLQDSDGYEHDFASEHEIDENKKERVEQIITQTRDPNFQYNPQEFWQQEVKINRKKPQLPFVPSQQKQQEQFQQFQREQLQKQLQNIHDKYQSKQDVTQSPQQQYQQQQQLQQTPQQQQSQQQSYQTQQQQNQSKNRSPPQSYLKQPQQDSKNQVNQFSAQKSFKKTIPSSKQLDQSQEQSFNAEQKQPQGSNPTSQQQLNNSQMSGIPSAQQLDKPEQNKQKQPKSKKKQDVPEINIAEPDEGSEITKKIEQQLLQVQSNLTRVKLGIIEKLLAAQSVYDVEIQDFKLADFPLNKTIFPKLDGEEEKQIFQQLFSWQKEIHQIIPIMNQLNRNLKVPDENEGTASQLVSSDEENN